MALLLSAGSLNCAGSLRTAVSSHFELPDGFGSARSSTSAPPRPAVSNQGHSDAGASHSKGYTDRRNNSKRASPVTPDIAPHPPHPCAPPLPPRGARRSPRRRNAMLEALDQAHLEDIRARARDASMWTCVVYYADRCRKCKAAMPEVTRLGTCEDLTQKFQFVRANIEEGSHAYQLAISKDVRGLPFAFVFKPNGDYAVGISARDVGGLKSKLELLSQRPDAVHFAEDEDGEMEVFD